ncbi:MAG: mechanosensitive ion channel family protein [Planctomycetota bacterium]|nr:mechanosensitive ion channel family protein [Planctomycetota bacterium]
MDALLTEFHTWLDDHVSTEPWLAAVILGVAVVLGFLAQWILTRAIPAMTLRTKTDLDEKIARVFQGPIVQTLVLAGLFLASGRLGMDEKITTVTLRGLLTIGLIIWTRTALRLAVLLLRFASERSDSFPLVEKRTFPLFSNLTVVVLLGIGSYLLLMIWRIDATAWAASAGVLGLALGFAAKDTLGNLFSGVFIVADAPYQLGDYIVMDDGSRGRVEHIGLRSTRILTRDDVQVTIPNSVIAQGKIVNQSGGGGTAMRCRAAVSVAYDSDLDKVRSVLEGIAVGEALILASPAPRVRFRRLGESGLDYEFLWWVLLPEQRGQAVDRVNTKIIERFREEGIQIPYPHRTLIVHQAPSAPEQ